VVPVVSATDAAVATDPAFANPSVPPVTAAAPVKLCAAVRSSLAASFLDWSGRPVGAQTA